MASAHHSDAARRTYAVRTGDTLSGVTQRFYGKDANWRSLYAANESKISNPNLIYVGEELRLPRHLPAPAAMPAQSSASTTSYTPRHASSGEAAGASSQAAVSTAATTTNLSGTLGCGGLEALWVKAGGSPGRGGHRGVHRDGRVRRQPVRHRNRRRARLLADQPGQRLALHLRSYGNARAAVIMSGNGTNWSPWTTYTSGAYAGRC